VRGARDYAFFFFGGIFFAAFFFAGSAGGELAPGGIFPAIGGTALAGGAFLAGGFFFNESSRGGGLRWNPARRSTTTSGSTTTDVKAASKLRPVSLGSLGRGFASNASARLWNAPTWKTSTATKEGAVKHASEIYTALIEHEYHCQGDTVIEVEVPADGITLRVYCIGRETKSVMECDYSEEFTAT
jgi:hypothetical protein